MRGKVGYGMAKGGTGNEEASRAFPPNPSNGGKEHTGSLTLNL